MIIILLELSDINNHLIGVLSPLETPVSLVTDFSKYLRIVAGGISNWLGGGRGVRTLLEAPPPKKHSHANPASYAGYLTVVASVQ